MCDTHQSCCVSNAASGSVQLKVRVRPALMVPGTLDLPLQLRACTSDQCLATHAWPSIMLLMYLHTMLTLCSQTRSLWPKHAVCGQDTYIESACIAGNKEVQKVSRVMVHLPSKLAMAMQPQATAQRQRGTRGKPLLPRSGA